MTLPTGPDGAVVRQIAEGRSVTTERGRLELLLTPGTFLRLDRYSTVRLLSSKLADVRVELVSGTAALEVNETGKGTSIVMLWREHAIPIKRTGFYRLEAAQDSLRVYVAKGKLRVPGRKGHVKSGRYVDLAEEGTVSEVLKYNRKDLDEFDLWNRVRSAELATASYVAVSSFRNRRSSLLSTGRSSQWFYHSGFGFYTFLPSRYSIRSPFGFVYRCPRPSYFYRQPSYPRGGYSSGGLSSRSRSSWPSLGSGGRKRSGSWRGGGRQRVPRGRQSSSRR